jgi:DNA-directed RNA polymerase specialized sigma24 family protein
MSFKVTEQDVLCRKLLNSSDVNERLQGVTEFYKIAAAKLPTLARMIAARFNFCYEVAKDIVNESLLNAVETFIAKIKAGEAPMDRRDESVLTYLQTASYNLARKVAKKAKREVTFGGLDVGEREPRVEPEITLIQEMHRDEELIAEIRRAVQQIVEGTVRGHKRGLFALGAVDKTPSTDNLGFAEDGLMKRLTEAGLADEISSVMQRYSAANISQQAKRLSQRQVAILFKVDAARVRQWMSSVRRQLMRHSMLLQEEARLRALVI